MLLNSVKCNWNKGGLDQLGESGHLYQAGTLEVLRVQKKHNLCRTKK